MREYSIYLPLKYNSGQPIEADKIIGILDQLALNFGAITVSPLSAPYQGGWRYGGVEYIDDIIKVEIVATEDRVTKKFLKDFKQQLMTDLQQIDILITSHGVQII